MISTYEFILNDGSKVRKKFFKGLKVEDFFLEELKQKVDKFIKIRNIFNPIINY